MTKLIHLLDRFHNVFNFTKFYFSTVHFAFLQSRRYVHQHKDEIWNDKWDKFNKSWIIHFRSVCVTCHFEFRLGVIRVNNKKLTKRSTLFHFHSVTTNLTNCWLKTFREKRMAWYLWIDFFYFLSTWFSRIRNKSILNFPNFLCTDERHSAWTFSTVLRCLCRSTKLQHFNRILSEGIITRYPGKWSN